MTSNEKMERAISQTMNNFHTPFLIFGKKKEHNPMEEFWMNKLEAIESQYDKHIIKLGRSLLDNKANKRRLIKKEEQISNLKVDLKEATNKLNKVSNTKSYLQDELTLKTYQTKRLGENLTKKEELKRKVLKSLEAERFERIKCEKELISLKQRLTNLERDKRFLLNDVAIKEGERRRVDDQNAQLAQNKHNLIKNLTEIDQERRIQAELNLKLVEDVGQLLKGCKTKQYTLLKQRKDIDLMLENMKQKRKEQEETLRKLGIQQKRMQDMHYDKKVSNEVMANLERQVMHWKEEFQFKEHDNKFASLEIKDLHRENRQLRCQLAELREKLTCNENHIKSLNMEMRRTEVELQKTKGQAHSVHLLMCRNELVKQKMVTKILKMNPHITQSLDAKTRAQIQGVQTKNSRHNLNEMQSYKTKIAKLERQKRGLEIQLNDHRGKQNRLQFQLKKYAGMEQQILWAEKGMVKLEGDRNRLEDLMKSMALNVPKKLPFEKLVTDPSILDRVSNYQVLQKRLLEQTEKVERIKKSAIKVMEYRKLKLEDEETDKRRDQIPKWKMCHWQSEDTLADVDQQLLDQEGIGVVQQTHGPTTMVDRNYYKDYMTHLDNEIPQLKQKIAVLERKQQYNQQQILDAEQKAKSSELIKVTHDDEKEFWNVEADEEEGDMEEEEEEEEEEGLHVVVSIDEPLSARKPSIVQEGSE